MFLCSLIVITHKIPVGVEGVLSLLSILSAIESHLPDSSPSVDPLNAAFVLVIEHFRAASLTESSELMHPLP